MSILPTRHALLMLCLAGISQPALAAAAASPGVEALLKQANYWIARGRGDMATKTLNRILAIDPGNAAATAALKTIASPPRPSPSPAVVPPVKRAVPADGDREQGAGAKPASSGDPGGNARAAGYDALSRGDLDTAAARFTAALRARPGDQDASGGLGLVRLRTRHFAEARDLLERASARGNGAKWARALASARFYADLNRARDASQAGHMQEAEELARELARSASPDRGQALILLGDILSAEGRNADAAAAYADAAPIAGDGLADLQTKLARARAAQAVTSGDLAAATATFQSALNADPGNVWLRLDYANFLLDHGDKPKAIGVMMPLNGLTSPDALYTSALFAQRIGTPLDAAALMEKIPSDRLTPPMKALLIDLKMAEAIERIRSLRAQGNVAAALTGARDLATSPEASVSTLGQLADLMLTMGATTDAQAAAERALQLPLGDPGDYQSAVSVLARTGQDGDAQMLITRLAGQTSGPAITRLGAILAANQAERLRMQGQNAAAFDVLHAAWINAPSDRDILGALARLYQGGGFPAQAEQVYLMLLNQKSEDLPSWIGLAEAAATARDFDRARDAAQRAITLDPKSVDAYLAAAHVAQAQGNKGAALRYLRQAQALSRPSLRDGEIFPTTNPFGTSQAVSNPFLPARTAAINPFALPATPAHAMPSPSVPTAIALPPGLPQGDVMPGVGTAQSFPLPAVAGGVIGQDSRPSPARGLPATTDPTLARINQEIAALAGDAGPSIDASAYYRSRSGESGESRLREIGAKLSASTRIGSVKVTASVSPVVLDAGSLSSSAQRSFGRNPSLDAAGLALREYYIGQAAFPFNAGNTSFLIDPGAQHDSGIAPALAIEAGGFKADIGTTPIGFRKTNIQGGASWSSRLGEHVTIGLHGERRPVTDSLLSYAGAKYGAMTPGAIAGVQGLLDDLQSPGTATVPNVAAQALTTEESQQIRAVLNSLLSDTGKSWGSVMRSGGGASVSYDDQGSGIYADGSYHDFNGRNVLSNRGFEGNLGGYLGLYKSNGIALSAGANLNYQSYRNNQNYFSLGYGGYFSPQSFVSIAFPIHLSMDRGRWRFNADLSPGFQSYQQDEAAIYPMLPGDQATLDIARKYGLAGVLSNYASLSQSGGAFAGAASGSYQVAPATRVSGEIKYNSFGVYKEFQTMLSIKQSLGSDPQ